MPVTTPMLTGFPVNMSFNIRLNDFVNLKKVNSRTKEAFITAVKIV
jgi:hypothetical protein